MEPKRIEREDTDLETEHLEQALSVTEKRGVSGAVLKWVAILTMLIDHIGAAFLEGMYVSHQYRWGTGIFSYEFDAALRIIGRLAFPIFCFLLVEGLFHTRSRWKYLLRLAIFALISEIPFDLAFQRTWWSMQYQNVFFTLAFGLSACAAWEWLTKGNERKCRPLRALAAMLIAFAACDAAYILKTDYGALGVLLILVMYFLREKPWARDLLGIGVLYLLVLVGGSHWIELFGALSFPLFHLYNGTRGRQPKYFFYIFYPAHLLLLFGLLMLVR